MCHCALQILLKFHILTFDFRSGGLCGPFFCVVCETTIETHSHPLTPAALAPRFVHSNVQTVVSVPPSRVAHRQGHASLCSLGRAGAQLFRAAEEAEVTTSEGSSPQHAGPSIAAQNSMGSDRRSRRHGRNDAVKSSESDGARTRTPSRRRSTTDVKEEDTAQDEEVMDHGNGSYDVEPTREGKDADKGKRSSGKRKREAPPLTKGAVRQSEPFLFYNALLLELVSKKACEDFLKPVLEMWQEEMVPGYRERIKRPMDLGTVKDNLRNDTYITENNGVFYFDQERCANDIRLIFENCMDYNDPDSDIHDTARDLLKSVNSQIAQRDTKLAREQENVQKKAKRDHERRRRKKAEEEAARAAANARKAASALERVKKEAEEAEKMRQQEIKRKEAEWKHRMEAEKNAAVALAVQEALSKQQQQQQKDRDRGASRMVNTSSVSSDEHEGMTGEVTFVFVSTVGMEKKRGRKSAVVMDLEQRHDELMKRRRAMVDACIELEKLKVIEMTYEEKRVLCQDVAGIDFVRMKGVADIIAKGMNRPDILNEVEVDLDVDHIDNVVLREIQFFLMSPTACTAKDALRQIESDIADIESKLVDIRYQKISG